MNQYEFKKFPLVATLLAALALLLSVLSITFSLTDSFYGASISLGLSLLVASVLFVAGLTTSRVVLSRTISIITYVCVIVTNFVLTIVNFETHDLGLFTLSILMLIATVLGYIYFLTAFRSERIMMMYKVASYILIVLTLAYAILFLVKDTTDTDGRYVPFYFILFSYTVIVSVPLAIQYSLSRKEEEPNPEEQSEEKAE